MLGRSCASNRPRGYKHRAEAPPSLPDGKADCRVPPDTPKRLLQGPTARAPYRAQNAQGDREQPAHAPTVATAIAAQCPKTERFCSCRYMNQTRASSSSKNRLHGQAPSWIAAVKLEVVLDCWRPFCRAVEECHCVRPLGPLTNARADHENKAPRAQSDK